MKAKLLLALVVTGALGGCVSTESSFHMAESRMSAASKMNTAIVNNAMASNACPPGYHKVEDVVAIRRKSESKYEQEVGRRGRKNVFFPYAEHEAEDTIRARSTLICTR